MRDILLRQGEVLVCSITVDHVDDADFAALWQVLSPDEHARADRFPFAWDRVVYVVAHALLRSMLATCMEGPVAFSRNRWGKPAVDRPDNRLQFSLTHTGGLAACALAFDGELGIDAEARTPETDVFGVAEHAFAPVERDQLRAAPELRRQDVFLTLWTLKEAFVKAMGRGLSVPLADFAFTLEPLSLRCRPELGVAAETWAFRTFALGAEHWMSVARSSPAQPGLRLIHHERTPAALAAAIRAGRGPEAR